MTRRRTHRGFSLIELLVVIVVLAFLFALLMPAQSKAREAARRASCSVKLKNVAVALHLYHDHFKSLPPSAFYKDGQNLGDKDITLKSVVPGEGGNGATRAPYSFMVKVLPYLEARHIYDRIDFQNDEAFDSDNALAASKIVAFLTCPSLRGQVESQAPDYAKFAGTGDRPALTQYKALGATTLACLQDSASVTNDKLDGGILHPYAAYSFTALPAAAQTAMLAETKEEKYSAWWDGTTASIPGFYPGQQNVKDDRELKPEQMKPALNLSRVGDREAFILKTEFGGQANMTWGPSSEHPGLVNHAFGDTGVRSISNRLNPTVYRAMISRRADDNEALKGFFE